MRSRCSDPPRSRSPYAADMTAMRSLADPFTKSRQATVRGARAVTRKSCNDSDGCPFAAVTGCSTSWAIRTPSPEHGHIRAVDRTVGVQTGQGYRAWQTRRAAINCHPWTPVGLSVMNVDGWYSRPPRRRPSGQPSARSPSYAARPVHPGDDGWTAAASEPATRQSLTAGALPVPASRRPRSAPEPPRSRRPARQPGPNGLGPGSGPEQTRGQRQCNGLQLPLREGLHCIARDGLAPVGRWTNVS